MSVAPIARRSSRAVQPAPDEEAIRSKAVAHVGPDVEAPAHAPQDVAEIKAYLHSTVVASGQATPQEVDETLDDVDRDIHESRQEQVREAAPEGPAAADHPAVVLAPTVTDSAWASWTCCDGLVARR